MTTTPRKTLLVLGGPAIGKSTIALFAANEPSAAERFGSRRAFIQLDQGGATSASLIRQSIARAIGLPSEGDTWNQAREELTAAPSLLILDNFETAWESDRRDCEALLRELATIPTVTVCATLRGAERPAHVAWDSVFEVHKLDHIASLELFERVSGAEDREDPLLGKLLEQMDGVPLALELLGEQRQFTSLTELTREWNHRKTLMLARSDTSVDRLGSLAVSIELSLASPRVTAAGAVLFRMLGRLPGGFSARHLSALLGEQGFAGASSLRRTRLAYDRGDRIVLLAPVREYADTLPLEATEEHKIAEHFLDLLRHHAPSLGNAATDTGVGMLAAEAANLEPAIRLALANGMVAEFEHLAAGLADFQRFSGLGSPEVLLGVSAAAHRAGKAVVAGRAMLRAGEVYLHRSKYQMAIKAFEDAREAFAVTDERISETTCVKCGGDVLWELGQLGAAKRAYSSALRGYRRSLHRNIICANGMANCWSRLAAIAIQEKRPQIAQKAISRARALYRDPADPLGEANCTLLSGRLALLEERVADAALGFSDARAQFSALGDREGQGESEIGLAAVAEHNQDKDSRAEHLAAALIHFRAQQSPHWIGQVHYLLSESLTGTERTAQIEAARRAWDAIDRHDLIAGLPNV